MCVQRFWRTILISLSSVVFKSTLMQAQLLVRRVRFDRPYPCLGHRLFTLLFCHFYTAGEDFTVPSSFTSPFFLNSDNLQQCFNVTIIDDEDYEGEESISLTITFITTGNLQVNFDSQSTTTTIVIADREGEPTFRSLLHKHYYYY